MSVFRLPLAWVFALLAALPTLLALPTLAAEIAPGTAGRCDITLKGILREGDGKTFAGELSKLAANPQVTLCLDSGGGDYLEALDIIRTMIDGSDANVATRIEKGARCLSACALVFLAGHQGEDAIRPARTMDANAQLGFHGPYLSPDDADYDPRQAPLAYQAGVQAIGELMALSTGLDLFPESLLVAALDKEPGAFLLIDTVQKAGRWSISVDGTYTPVRLDRHMLHQACVNHEDWRLDLDINSSHQREVRRELLLMKGGKARTKFDGFGDEAAWVCTVDAVEFAPGRFAIDIQWSGGFNDAPQRSTDALLRAARAAKGTAPVGKPIWSMLPPGTLLRQIAIP